MNKKIRIIADYCQNYYGNHNIPIGTELDIVGIKKCLHDHALDVILVNHDGITKELFRNEYEKCGGESKVQNKQLDLFGGQ